MQTTVKTSKALEVIAELALSLELLREASRKVCLVTARLGKPTQDAEAAEAIMKLLGTLSPCKESFDSAINFIREVNPEMFEVADQLAVALKGGDMTKAEELFKFSMDMADQMRAS